MNDLSPPAGSGTSWSLRRQRLALAGTFLLVHAVLVAVNLSERARNPLGDVTGVYLDWMNEAVNDGVVAGIDTPWVYPVAALLPMTAAYLFGPELYGQSWLMMVVVLDGVATWLLARRSMAASWWWLAFLAALGPIALVRVDAITIPIAVIAALRIVERPAVAGALLALAVWIKVWPAAIIGAGVLVLRRRIPFLVGATIASVAVVAAAVALGARGNLLSFVSAQTGRGLQLEAPVTLPWVWNAVLHLSPGEIYWDWGILTYQVTGRGSGFVASLMTPLLLIVVSLIIAMVVVALRREADRQALLVDASLALVTALVVFNKVGSPQYISWFAVPIIMGILIGRPARGAMPLTLIVIAALTQVFFPWNYTELTEGHVFPALVMTVRNLLLMILMAWSLVLLWRSARSTEDRRGSRPPLGETLELPLPEGRRQG